MVIIYLCFIVTFAVLEVWLIKLQIDYLQFFSVIFAVLLKLEHSIGNLRT